MLIIEGADCLGKTILAKKIVQKVSDMGLPVVYSHMTRPNDEKFDFFQSYKLLINPYAIQDRFHLSGVAYHKDKISKRNLQIINAWIRSVGGMIIILYAGDVQRYRQRIESDKHRHLLNTMAMRNANFVFSQYAIERDYFSFDILPNRRKLNSPILTTLNWVKDSDVDEIVEEWLIRRRSLGLGDV